MPHIVPSGPSFPGQKGIGHQPNEWMKIEDLNTECKNICIRNLLFRNVIGESMERIIEICCGSYEDALNSYHGGAKRIELNNALHLGGLTPSLATLKLTKKNTNLKVITMVRPRGAGFCYNEIEFEVMKEDAKSLLENGADGIAFGCLNKDGSICIKQTKEMIEIIKSYQGEVVFHRAFDCVEDPYTSIELLIELGVDRYFLQVG